MTIRDLDLYVKGTHGNWTYKIHFGQERPPFHGPSGYRTRKLAIKAGTRQMEAFTRNSQPERWEKIEARSPAAMSAQLEGDTSNE